MAVDTLGQLLAVHVTPAGEQERAQVGELARQVQQATATLSGWRLPVRAIPVRSPRRQHSTKASSFRVIKLPEVKKASCCCRAAGWSSIASDGAIGSAD